MSRSQYRILIHGLAISLGIFPPLLLVFNSTEDFDKVFVLLGLSLAVIPLYVINLKILIPKLLQKQKYLYFILSILGLLLIYGVLFNKITPFDVRRISVLLADNEPVALPAFPIPPIIPFMLMLLMGTTLEMLLAYEQRGKQIEQTQLEKISAELSFLKSQINPHFFFNTLNNIYSLASIDTGKTQKAILLLSNLMRYLLYESDAKYVELSKEIQFINDFMGLQKLRGSTRNEKKVSFSYEGNVDDFKIEPRVLMPFVENAYKHSHSYDKQAVICMNIRVNGNNSMEFTCKNSIGEQKELSENDSGIGLENVKRRLELIYPNSHTLEIDKSNAYYNVKLIIDNEVHSR